MNINIDATKSAIFLIALLLLSYSAAPARASAGQVLRVLAWTGYADPAIVSAFEQRYQATVEVTYADSDDDLWYKINHDNYDVFAVNTAELQRYIDRQLIRPVSLENIPNHAKQLPRFQDLQAIPGVVRDGHTYAMPYTYSEMGLIYNRQWVKDPPRSMAAMWNPAYRGQVLAFNASNHNFSLAGLLLGIQNPFRMDDAQLELAAPELVKLRRNVLTFYGTVNEATELFRRYPIALVFGNYGRQQVKALTEAGADIGYAIPDEGALAWLDCWAIPGNAQHPELAEKWINYTLEKSVSEHLTDQHGLANTVTPSRDNDQNQHLIWLEPVLNPDKRKTLWDRIISGEPLEAF